MHITSLGMMMKLNHAADGYCEHGNYRTEFIYGIGVHGANIRKKFCNYVAKILAFAINYLSDCSSSSSRKSSSKS